MTTIFYLEPAPGDPGSEPINRQAAAITTYHSANRREYVTKVGKYDTRLHPSGILITTPVFPPAIELEYKECPHFREKDLVARHEEDIERVRESLFFEVEEIVRRFTVERGE